MMSENPVFEFATAGRIIFGDGSIQQLGSAAAALGIKPLLVVGAPPAILSGVVDTLAQSGLVAEIYPVPGEPTISSVLAGVDLARQAGCDLVIGCGGGSALDTAKAVAGLAQSPGDALDYLEVVGAGKTLPGPVLPVVAIPTTAGTGSEVTRNAVLGVPEQRVKVSLRSPLLLPRLALVDPQLTLGLPPAITASTGLDALTQLIEPFVCNRPNPLTDAVCREGMQRASRSLEWACQDGQSAAPRRDMSLASLFGGLALANARLGAVHGLAGPLGGMFPAPHGVICARLLPLVTRANLRALREREPQNPALARYQLVAATLTGDPGASPDQGVAWLSSLVARLPIPRLGDFGMLQADIADVIDRARRSSSMQGNPLLLTERELYEILLEAL